MTWLQPPGFVHAMITASWQPGALNATVKSASQPPTWTTVPDKSLRCSGSEYRGQVGATTADECLAAAQKKGGVNYAIWATNKNCYVCAITDRGDASTWPLAPQAGVESFVGRHILSTASVSAQLSADGGTAVVRIVNLGSAPRAATIGMSSFAVASASAVALAASDMSAVNTPANVDNVSPRPIGCRADPAGATLTVPGFAYTVVTLTRV